MAVELSGRNMTQSSTSTSSEDDSLVSGQGRRCAGACCGLWDHALDSFEYHFKVKDRIKQRMAKEGETWDEALSRLQADWSVHDQLNRDLPTFEAPPRDPSAAKSVAFMFLTVAPLNREDVWVPWFESAPRGQYDIIVHNDKETSLGALGSLARHVNPPTLTGWASSGLVRATLVLLREALKNCSNTHFILLSNSEIPLCSFADFYKKVTAASRSRFNKMSLNWDESLGRNIWQRATVTPCCAAKGMYSKADQWTMWTREDAAFFAERNFLPYLKPHRLFVDEPYFIQIMQRYGRPFEDKHVTFTKWRFAADSPEFYRDEVSSAIIAEARRGDAWFLRKVAKEARLPDTFLKELSIK